MQAMKTVTLDAHTERSQMAVISAHGEILIELQVETTPEELRRVVSGIPGPKRVILESGPFLVRVRTVPGMTRQESQRCRARSGARARRRRDGARACSRACGGDCRNPRAADRETAGWPCESTSFAGWGEFCCCFRPSQMDA